MKMLKFKKVILSVILILLCCGCDNNIGNKNNFNIICDKQDIYVNDSTIINIDTNMEFTITNVADSVLEIVKETDNNIEVKGISEGEGQIIISAGKNYNKTIVIKVNNRPMPTELNIRIKENGPYYYKGTYHLELEIYPKDALKNIELNYNRNYMTINEETMEVTFNKAGEFYISCYSTDNFELEAILNFEVVYNPDDSLYRVLFVGNSLTKYKYDISDIVEEMMKAAGLDAECESSIASGLSLIDQKSKVETLLRDFRYTHVILQEHSYGPISKYEQFENTVLYLAEKVKENKASLILYQTWAYNKDVWNGLTKAEMTEKLAEAYDKVAEKTEAGVNRVGEAFALYESKNQNWPSLYTDMNHPSNYGAFLSICVHYASITGKRASDNPYQMEGIDVEMIENIKGIADEIVFGK